MNGGIVTPLSWRSFEHELSSHPDKAFADSVVSGIRFGFSLGYDGPQVSYNSGNMSSVLEHNQVVKQYIEKEVEEGRVHGPFREHPWRTSCVTLLGWFLRRR